MEGQEPNDSECKRTLENGSGSELIQTAFQRVLLKGEQSNGQELEGAWGQERAYLKVRNNKKIIAC